MWRLIWTKYGKMQNHFRHYSGLPQRAELIFGTWLGGDLRYSMMCELTNYTSVRKKVYGKKLVFSTIFNFCPNFCGYLTVQTK